MTDYKEEIAKSCKVLKEFRKSKELFDNEKAILDLMKQRYRLYWSQIHEYLAPKKKHDAEMEIRKHLKDIFVLDLPVCERKAENFKNYIEKISNSKKNIDVEPYYQYLQEWLILYENFYALVAFRSLAHFAQFWEWDFSDEKKLWKYSLDPYGDGGYTGLINGFFHYATQAVLDKSIRFIEKQMPSGTGKSYSDILFIGFAVGVDLDNDVLKVFGNPANLEDCGGYLKDMFCSPRYAKVFPYFQQFHDMEGDIEYNLFKVCKISKEVTITINGSTKTNVRVVSKDKKISGVRARFIMIDDITQQEDTDKMARHEWDWNTFWGVWFKRRYTDGSTCIIASGTTYHYMDILTRLKAYYSNGKVIRSAMNKYTFLNEEGDCVFVVVPRIDMDTGETTLPQKFSTKESLEIKRRNEREFWAMEMQQPLPPANSPFYKDNIQLYDVIPSEGRSDFCWASLDSARIGYDYNSMPIFVKVGDKFYLKDCLYLNEPMDSVYPRIIEKIIQHNITKFVIEKNIDTSLKALLDKMLAEKGIFYCEIIEVYSTIKKEEKIFNMENTIKHYCVFPNEHLYTISSQMGRFMYDLMGFSYTSKNEHDDSIDSVATFCQRLIVSPARINKPKLLYI